MYYSYDALSFSDTGPGGILSQIIPFTRLYGTKDPI